MRKTILVSMMVICILTVLGFVSLALSEDRAAGQCSYHGGVDKDTGKCKDGTAVGAGSAPKEKPDPAIAAKAKACKAATAKYNSLTKSASWMKILAGHLGDNADECFKKWDETYAPKIAACKTDSCRNGYQNTINKKYEACEVADLWALEWVTKVRSAQTAMDSACSE